ncbi:MULTISPECIES: hypothetical protein [Microbulbifer]|uniref:Uncharacterized protein n=1 Tax=Microbulbifer celer TaxID=435905 RepID=A0ABW3U6F1_9GAMM|nr:MULTISPECIES: hypothetical protein [Microbulbifer]UFN56044.1 hypothetical protein LPW13_10690 [Microbulbifer celer]
MKISYPFNVTNQRTGQVIEHTIAFNNRNSSSFQGEITECTKLGVPRAKLGDPNFKEVVDYWARAGGVKWVYTVFKELYVIPAMFHGGYEPPHSYAAANAPVFCAGFADFDPEVPNQLNVNHWSGHYQPSPNSLNYYLAVAWQDCGYTIMQVGR